MRYFIELRYRGTNYCGWQRQNNEPTVQGAIEKALAILLKKPTPITGAGRTDTGVHASFYVAHFDCEVEIVDPDFLRYKLNIILPEDISISKIYRVEDDAHARFDAKQREYRYFIERHKNPFTRDSAWQYYVDLDMEAMNRAAQRLLLHSDFTSFAKLNSNNKTNICSITDARWTLSSQGEMIFTIRADRFLRNMVRAIVGTLVDVGRGKYTVDEFDAIISSRDLSRCSAGAPAQGLFLSGIEY
ncbi:MAG: tRNA pseudouridine(38-40) synthase TruA [Rikenellaceae bacterium]